MAGAIPVLLSGVGIPAPNLPTSSWSADSPTDTASSIISLQGFNNLVRQQSTGHSMTTIGPWMTVPYDYLAYETRLTVQSAGTSGWTNTDNWLDVSTNPQWTGVAVGANTVATVRLEVRHKTVTSISDFVDYIVFFVVS